MYVEYDGFSKEAAGPILAAEHATYRYQGEIPALSDVTLDVRPGEILSVIGSNGSGKSTLLHLMNGLIHPSSGSVRYKGKEVSAASLKEPPFLRAFRSQVGYIFQDSDVQLFCPTVADELLFGPLQLGIPEAEARERTDEVLRMLEIDDLRSRPSYMLSAGEKKRVAIGSILTMNPEVLLLDEPTNGLDPRSQVYLIELVLGLNEAGKTFVIATHDLSLVNELHCRVAVLSEDHRLEKAGEACDILGDEALLLKVNLIHDHRHYHGGATHHHTHSHYLFHRHDRK